MSIRDWFRDHDLDWSDVVVALAALAAFAVVAGISVALTAGCAATHGGHWWCWL